VLPVLLRVQRAAYVKGDFVGRRDLQTDMRYTLEEEACACMLGSVLMPFMRVKALGTHLMRVERIFYAETVYHISEGSGIGLEQEELAPEAICGFVVILGIVVNTGRLDAIADVLRTASRRDQLFWA
jgi:hypothetical protein